MCNMAPPMFNSEQMISTPYSESHSFPVQYLIKTLVTLSVLDWGKNTFNTLIRIWQHIYGLLHSLNIADLKFWYNCPVHEVFYPGDVDWITCDSLGSVILPKLTAKQDGGLDPISSEPFLAFGVWLFPVWKRVRDAHIPEKRDFAPTRIIYYKILLQIDGLLMCLRTVQWQ